MVALAGQQTGVLANRLPEQNPFRGKLIEMRRLNIRIPHALQRLPSPLVRHNEQHIGWTSGGFFPLHCATSQAERSDCP
jgi:hypothetical protein